MPEKVEEFLGGGLKSGVESRYIVQEEPKGERLVVRENTTLYQ